MKKYKVKIRIPRLKSTPRKLEKNHLFLLGPYPWLPNYGTQFEDRIHIIRSPMMMQKMGWLVINCHHQKRSHGWNLEKNRKSMEPKEKDQNILQNYRLDKRIFLNSFQYF